MTDPNKRVAQGIAVKKPTVYLVDSDRAALEAMHALLASLDVDIEQFTSAEGFLHKQRTNETGCLVANVTLPGMGGLALIEMLKQRDLRLPNVLIDNLGDVRTAVKAIRAGVVDYIEKPCADRLLLNAVSEAINASVEQDHKGSFKNP